MNAPQEALDEAIRSIEILRKQLTKSKSAQVRSAGEISIAKASAYAWFNSFRESISSDVEVSSLERVDTAFRNLLEFCDKHTTRTKYHTILKSIKSLLFALRGEITVSLTNPPTTSDDELPKFDNLISDQKMVRILEARWIECARCVENNAPLAATVVMGGLLEALLLARVHRESNKTIVFNASTAPVDSATRKPQPLQKWSLKHYIDVAHELGWITSSAKDVGVVMRDYRNYIHPHKEYSHGVTLNKSDAELLWEISKGISRQLVK